MSARESGWGKRFRRFAMAGKHRNHRGHGAWPLRPLCPLCRLRRAGQGVGGFPPFFGRLLTRQDTATGARACGFIHGLGPRLFKGAKPGLPLRIPFFMRSSCSNLVGLAAFFQHDTAPEKTGSSENGDEAGRRNLLCNSLVRSCGGVVRRGGVARGEPDLSHQNPAIIRLTS